MQQRTRVSRHPSWLPVLPATAAATSARIVLARRTVVVDRGRAWCLARTRSHRDSGLGPEFQYVAPVTAPEAPVTAPEVHAEGLGRHDVYRPVHRVKQVKMPFPAVIAGLSEPSADPRLDAHFAPPFAIALGTESHVLTRGGPPRRARRRGDGARRPLSLRPRNRRTRWACVAVCGACT